MRGEKTPNFSPGWIVREKCHNISNFMFTFLCLMENGVGRGDETKSLT